MCSSASKSHAIPIPGSALGTARPSSIFIAFVEPIRDIPSPTESIRLQYELGIVKTVPNYCVSGTGFTPGAKYTIFALPVAALSKLVVQVAAEAGT
jgi:hypothetical protein